MKSMASRAPGGRVVLDVEVAPEDMAPDIEQAFRRLAKQVRVPGFRPGRAPAVMLERVLGRDRVLREALDDMVNRAYRSALDEQSLVPIDQPQVEVQSFEDGQPLRFQATVSVRPEVRLGDYAAVRVAREVAPVQPGDIDGALEDLRVARGTWVPVEDAPAAEGHLVIVDIAGQVEGGRPVEESRVEGVVGSGRLRQEIDQAVRGVASGGSVEVELHFGTEEPNRLLAGKSAQVRVSVREVKRLELAALDDAFAAQVSPGSTLEELRREIGGRLQAAAERHADQAVAEKALTAVVDGAEVEIPDLLVQRGVDNLLAEMEQQFTAAGVTLASQLEAQGRTLEALRADLVPSAERRVKTELVVDALAEHAGVVPDLRDMDEEIDAVARDAQVSPVEFRKVALRPENWSALRFNLVQRRVVRLLAEIAGGVPAEEAATVAIAASRRSPAADGAGAAAVPGNPPAGAAAGDRPADGEGGRA